MGEMSGKVAIITGGASGIGEASTRLFVEKGARVVIADMQEERGNALATELGDAAIFSLVEVRQEQQVKTAVDTAISKWGRLDCMFNNAGFGGALGPLETTSVEEFEMTFDVLVKGVFLGMKHAIPVMRQQSSGCIINTGSVAAVTAGLGPLLYSAAKASVVHLSKVTALSVADSSIRVNTICPGYIATPLSSNTVGKPDELIEERLEGRPLQQPMPRIGRPNDIAETALFLASDRATFITGQTIIVDGGAASGVFWENQNPIFKTHRPIRVYNPDQH